MKIKDNYNIILSDLKKPTFNVCFNSFYKVLATTYPSLANNNLFYVNIWSLMCKPCIDEIPFLDTLPTILNKNISYVMVSSHSDEAVIKFLNSQGIRMKNFAFINEMFDFISGIYNEIDVETQSFPLHVILDNKGNCLAYLFGSIHDNVSARPIIDFVGSVK